MTDKERELALYCLKASSDYHSEVCENCINYPNCDHTIQDDVTETIIKALEQEPKTIEEKQAESQKYQKAFEDGYENGYAQARFDYEQESKTGHWIEKDGYDGDTYYDCSECGESWTTIEGTPWNNGMKYCPNCGAKMGVVSE